MKHKSMLACLAILITIPLIQQAQGDVNPYNIVLPMKPSPPPTCYDRCRETCAFICKSTNISDLTFLSTVKKRKKHRTELDLSFNNLKSLKRNEISATNFKIIREIYFEYNQITTIEEEALNGLDFLEQLYLSGNPLRIFFKNSFDSISLDTLMLDSCGIKTLPKGIFKNTPKLKLLNLNNNNLTELNIDIFRSLQNLQEIHIGSNFLSDLNTNTFEGLHNLKILNLTQNRITYLEEGLLNNLISLKDVQLGNNFLTKIDANTFRDNLNLISMDFSNNLIETIQDGLFSSLKQLRSIKLNNNQLTTLKIQTFSDLISNSNNNNLRVGSEFVFNLENNPWHCEGCGMLKVYRWLRENTTQDYHFKWCAMICASPEIYKDKSWTFVPWNESEVNCVESPPMRSVTERAEVATRTLGGLPTRPELRTIMHEVMEGDIVTEGFDMLSNVTSVQFMAYIEEDSNICVFQYYFLGSYALFVLISACTVWVIIYKEKLSEMHEERFYE